MEKDLERTEQLPQPTLLIFGDLHSALHALLDVYAINAE